MSDDCYHINPLQHGGTSQEFRMAAELDPAFAPIDARNHADMFLFMEQYGELINYYDFTNSINGDWTSFLSNDISTILASMTVEDPREPVETWYKFANKFETANLSDLKDYSKTLFDVTFTLLDQVRRWNDRLPPSGNAKKMIMNEIMSRMAFDMRDALLYYLYGTTNGLVNDNHLGDPAVETFHYLNTEAVLLNNFRQEWWAKFNAADTILDWDDYKVSYLAVPSTGVTAYGDVSWDDVLQIRYALSFLKDTFTRIYESYARIIAVSKKFLLESITAFPDHKANNGLMIAFLLLFGKARDALNTFTDRHLDFYYKDVLRIDRKPAVPDSVHAVIIPAKNVKDSYTKEKNTALFAGKDKEGKELLYYTTDDISLNQGQVASLKSIFFDPDLADGGIYAAEVSNSADGNGKKLDEADPSWFGYGQPQTGLTEPTMTESQIGFVISCPVLFLSEGMRKLRFEISIENDFVSNPIAANELAGQFEIYYTGKKDWVLVPDITGFNVADDSAIAIESSPKKIHFNFVLSEGDDPLLAYNAGTHKGSFSTAWPAVKFILKKNISPLLYLKLKNVTIYTVRITADVSNAKSCILHSDAGSLENKSPFMPFGPRPKLGSSLFFGSPEVFRKRLTSFNLHLQWHGTPQTSFKTHYDYDGSEADGTLTNYIGLNTGLNSFIVNCNVGGTGNKGDVTLFDSNDDQTIDVAKDIIISNLFPASEPDIPEFATYDPGIYRGFLQLSLVSPAKAFGHDVFTTLYANQVVLKSLNKGVTLPNDPYTPLLKPLTYDYVAEEYVSLLEWNINQGQYFQVFPFGFAERKEACAMVYPFEHDEGSTTVALQGCLLIGINKIKEDEQLNLYFEMSEGSEDSSLDPSGIYWSYLSGNEWIRLDPLILADSTNGMLGSGIIRFLVPEEMNETHTILPSGTRWVRAAVKDTYIAYPKIFAVFTNAVKATFRNNSNATDHLSSPLAAGKIAKLYHADGRVKKLEQPYPSFDGRPVETSATYYTRVSERLRHKNRAITIWDYERLLLEEFNSLYKVKCLNHTNDITETAPGCVRIVVIPDVSHKSTGNLFKPAVSNNKREKIRKYITALNCPFADLQVENPRYEEVRISCQIKFSNDAPDVENINRVKEDVDKFLAPWAYDESRGIDFGGKIHQSQIINYLEKLSYIDYVTDFYMNVYYNGLLLVGNVPEAKASKSRSVLTSEQNHDIGVNVCLT